MSFGMMEALLSFFRRQVGLRTDTADVGGSLHAKLKQMGVVLQEVSALPPLLEPFFGNDPLSNITISSNSSLSDGYIHRYNNLTVNAGITLNVNKSIILVKDTLTVNGLISASGKGGLGGLKPGTGDTQPGQDGYGYAGAGGGGGWGYSSYGKNGGSTLHKVGGSGGAPIGGGQAGGWYVNLPAALFWDMSDYIINACGAGGGASGRDGDYYNPGGDGGGSILLFARKINVNSSGAIRADGIDGGEYSPVGGGGGGGGGLIYILAMEELVIDGVVSASGGSGGRPANYDWGGNGGNGCVTKVVLS